MTYNLKLKTLFLRKCDVYINNKKLNFEDQNKFYDYFFTQKIKKRIILSKYFVFGVEQKLRSFLSLKSNPKWIDITQKVNLELVKKITADLKIKEIKTLALKDHKESKFFFFDMAKNIDTLPICLINYLEVILTNQYNISKKNIKHGVVIDAGSNVGEFAIYAGLLGAKKVYAFEPVTKTYDILKNNIKINKLEKTVIPIKMALGDQPGKTKIFFNYSGDGGANISRNINTINYEKIKVIKLDDFIKKNEKINFIKMDVEGYEKQILLGAKRIIHKNKPILSFSAYHNSTDKVDLPIVVKKIRPDYKIKLLKRFEEDFYCI